MIGNVRRSRCDVRREKEEKCVASDKNFESITPLGKVINPFWARFSGIEMAFTTYRSKMFILLPS